MLRSVAVVLDGPVAPFELGVLCEAWGTDRSETGGPTFDLTVCTAEPGPIPTTCGFSIDVPHDLSATTTADLVALPALAKDHDLHPLTRQALVDAHARGALLLSVCSGSFALAQAGLLDGLRATTHWLYAEELAQKYPTVEVDADVLFVDTGQIITSAGTAAGLDACLYLVRRELGTAAAVAMARRMVMPPQREGGQQQFIATPMAASDDDAVGPLLEWMVAHVHEPLSVAQLARRVDMSERTFARRFRNATGTTPAQFLISQRVQRARELLEQGTAPLDEVAEHSGFGSSAAMRQHFSSAVGLSPAAYRRRFGAG